MLPRILLVSATMLSAGGSADEVLDRQQIIEAFTGGTERAQNTRSIIVERARPTIRPSAYTAVSLPAIQFEYDSARLTGVAEHQLRELGAALGTEPLELSRFEIQGHTDSRGDGNYNRDLSLRRAHAVTRFLVRETGVARRRLTAVGAGEDSPLAGLAPDDPRNRRVEVIELGTGPGSSVADPAGATDARALLIGIDAYPAFNSLGGGPLNDVAAIREFVAEDLGYDSGSIRTLLDADATRENIVGAIRDWLFGGDRALLYFSGHGYYQRDTNGDEPDGYDETLVPYDATFEKGMLTDDEIHELIAAAPHVAVDIVMDSCHSGTATRSAAGGDPRWIAKSPRMPDGSPLRAGGTRGIVVEPDGSFVDAANVTVWSAVQADQLAVVDKKTGRSVFTDRLLSGLRGEADADASGVVTSRELEDYVVRESEAYCERNPRCTLGMEPHVSVPPGMSDARAFARAWDPQPLAPARVGPASGAAINEPPVAASERLALVIGNSNYSGGAWGPLKNAGNDAVLMEETLKRVGFNVAIRIDADRRTMLQAIKEFGRNLAAAGSNTGAGLFYFAGHGAQSMGVNYLIPVGSGIEHEMDLQSEAVSAQGVLNRMAEMTDAKNRINIVVLDACRNNALPMGARSASRGLAKMSPPSGSFIAYSTAAGDVATDGLGLHSPFVESLAGWIQEPGVRLIDVFGMVRVHVEKVTGGKQTPWDEHALRGAPFYFIPPDGVVPTLPREPSAQITPVLAQSSRIAKPKYVPRDPDGKLWNEVKGSGDEKEICRYLQVFPDGRFVKEANDELNQLDHRTGCL